MKIKLTVLILVLGSIHVCGQAKIKIPYGNTSVMIDGKFEPAEWNDAYRLRITDSLELYFKQDKENIYWCLRALHRPQVLGGVNFYITHKDSILNLHASAKLGERVLYKGDYGDWAWWNNKSWMATVARPDKIEERKFLRDEAKEFQLRKSRFTDKQMRMMLDIESPQNLLPAYPQQATNNQTDQWLLLEW